MQYTNPSNFKCQFTISLIVLLIIVFTPQALAEASVQLSPEASEAARLLNMENDVQKFVDLKNSGKSETPEMANSQLAIVRKIMTAGLELRTTSAKIDRQLAFEQQARDRLVRDRDMAVMITNNANFLQLSILSIIIDGPLEQSHEPRTVYHGNILNIVSGLTVGGLAGIAFLEQKGGIRNMSNNPNWAAKPNMLGEPLGVNPPDDQKLPPMLWTYLNSVSPNSKQGLTRREQLIEYWKKGKILQININKESTREKVSAFGPHHSRWCETIKLINSRVTMLFDLRAMVDLLNTGLVELLQALE